MDYVYTAFLKACDNRLDRAMSAIVGSPSIDVRGLSALGAFILATGLFFKFFGSLILFIEMRREKKKLWREYWKSDGKHGDFESFYAQKKKGMK